MNAYIKQKKLFYSFEFFPPKTNGGVKNLFTRMDRMGSLEPMFMDVTWAGGNSAVMTLEISAAAQNFCQADALMHLTCTNMPKNTVKQWLDRAMKAGIKNILALRGDHAKGEEQWEQCEGGFAHAVDLVRFIKQEYGDYFGIAVAGYPEMHICATSLDDDIKHLREKVDAGADFIITQLFYNVKKFLAWVKKCRQAGIVCPIIPGIMPIQNYTSFKRMTSFCRTDVPKEILSTVKSMKDNDARVKAYGIKLGIEMCQALIASGIQGLHFYTLNLERSVIKILEGLGYVKFRSQTALPWKQSQVARRQKEDVRPIFWANRATSYLDRTAYWDEFPNGRWGDSNSPAFGNLSDYHLSTFRTGTVSERLKLWGKKADSFEKIFQVFANYINGTVSRLPWCEYPIQLETQRLQAFLYRMNINGFLTINSQPHVNGESSCDPAVGWGGPGGYVYQKAYLEFFCSPHWVKKIAEIVCDFPSINFQALNYKGELKTNYKKGKTVTAVTWGVFPGTEIIQPTVVDTEAFSFWKDEAFAIWKSQWQCLYKKGIPSEDSDSWNNIEQIRNTFYLVNVIDNDYIHGDIFALFEKLLSLRE